MRLIHKALLIFLSISLSVLTLEAKSLNFLFDHTTTVSVDLKPLLKEALQEEKELNLSTLAYPQLKIENRGDQPVRNFFPFTHHLPLTSLDRLASELANKKYPLLALYQLWDKSLIREEKAEKISCHPLDLLNFKGICSQESFKAEFIKLCQTLGIEMRLANVQGKNLYDFCLDDRWSFLDLETQQFYLDFDNETLISSEEVMDDPFLLLRTKHLPKNKPMSLAQGWQELAHFDILHPISAQAITLFPSEWIERAEGFDIYPHEHIVFNTSANQIELASHECSIQQTLDLEARQAPLFWNYLSPFPIKKIENCSSAFIELIDQKITIAPGESFSFHEKQLFRLHVSFSDFPKGKLIVSGICAAHLFPAFVHENTELHLGTEENLSVIHLSYEVLEKKEENKKMPALMVINKQSIFDEHSPHFLLADFDSSPESIWWQIALDNDFEYIPSNFNQIEPFTSSVTLPLISETLLNPDQTYYFRVKGYLNGQWGEWSSVYSFTVCKPLAVEQVEFDRVKQKGYELNWERYAEDSNELIEYLIFGSNSFDFIPSIYCAKQINEMDSTGLITYEEENNNLVAITTDCKLNVSGELAYYRIIARRGGQLSVPSRIIHVYDQDLVQPRDVLQVVEEEKGCVTKRTLFPAVYPWLEPPLPQVCQNVKSKRTKADNLIKMHQNLILMAGLRTKTLEYPYEFPDVSEEIWNEVRPYLLPANHPAWAKLHRVFCQTRATLDEQSFKKAGFKRWRPGKWSRVSASSHPEFKEYFIKCYCDSERGIIYDWKKWIHRIEGANFIRQCIKKNDLNNHFTVPHKWIYPLPKYPAPPQNPRYVRKNFILVCENMRLLEHDKNEKMYKKKMTPHLLKGLYTILQTCGLYDSVYCFNCPFCKDGRIAIIDCEYHHKWPVPFERLTKCFSKENRKYWKKLTDRGGSIPPGRNQINPPRMDRRDVPK